MGTIATQRETGLAAVERSIGFAREGRGNTLFVVGEAGLGKTTMLQEAAVIGRDLDQLSGTGDRMESMIPFGLLGQVFDEFGTDSHSRQPLSGADPPEVSATFLGLLEVARRRARHPLLILIDDLHWADRDSLDLIAFLARRLSDLPISLIATLRPWPNEVLDVARGLAMREMPEPGVTIERLVPFDVAATGIFLDDRLPGVLERDSVERCWHLSGGNPLLLELIAEAIAGGADLPEVAGGLDDAASELLLGRFAGLDPDEVAIAHLAAVCGDRFRTRVVVDAAESEGIDAEAALEGLYRSGLVVEESPVWLRFSHPLFAQALYDDLSPSVRQGLHRLLFGLHAEAGVESEAVEHAIKGGFEGDAEATGLLERVGRSALAAGAVASAADSLAAAVRFQGDGPDPAVMHLAAEATLAAGRPEIAAEYCERLLAMEELEWQTQVSVLRTLGRIGYLTGADDLGDAAVVDAIEIAISHDPAHALEPLFDRVSIHWMTRGPGAALEVAEETRELCREWAPEQELIADAFWGHLAVETGDPSGLSVIEPIERDHAQRRASGDSELGDLVWPSSALYALAHNLYYAERFDDSLAALRRGRSELESAGAANGVATVTIFIANNLARRGDLEGALKEADRAEEFSELTPFIQTFASLVRAEAHLWMGDFDRCERHLVEAAERLIIKDLWLYRVWSGHIRALALLWQGDSESSDRFLEVERLSKEVGLVELTSPPWVVHAVEAHLAAGRTAEAERVTGEIEDLASGMGTYLPLSLASRARARMMIEAGDPEPALERFERSVTLLDDLDLPIRRAESLVAFGIALRRAGREIDARPPLSSAVELAEGASAGFLADRAAAELRLAGGRRRRSIERRVLLSPAEMRVAREASLGATNAEIGRRLHLSVNTVKKHLTNSYAKLGINSRRKLAGRLDQVPDGETDGAAWKSATVVNPGEDA